MNSCDNLNGYIDHTLSLRHRASFSAHLSTCTECNRNLSDWSLVRTTLNGAFVCEDSAPTFEQAEQLLAAAAVDTVRSPEPRTVRKIALWTAAAAAVFAGVLFIAQATFLKAERQISPPESPSVSNATSPARPTPETPRSFLPQGLQTFGGRRLWVEEKESVASGSDSAQTIEISSGSVGVSTDDRTNPISVKAGRYTVRDIGTVFSVSYTPNEVLEVTVADGMVEVDGFGEMPVRVQRRQRLTIIEDAFVRLDEIETAALENLFVPQTPAADTRPASTDRLPKNHAESKKTTSKADTADIQADIERWRRMVLNGQYDDAVAALTDYLNHAPNNGAAWSILSDCYRKQHQWKAAVEANEHVIDHGTPSERRRAQFLTGEIYQDRLNDPAAAASYFDKFSASSKPSSLRASALLRAAKAYLVLGNREKAFELFREIDEGPYDEQQKASARALRDAH